MFPSRNRVIWVAIITVFIFLYFSLKALYFKATERFVFEERVVISEYLAQIDKIEDRIKELKKEKKKENVK